MERKPLLMSIAAALLLILTTAGTSFSSALGAPAPATKSAAAASAGCGKAPTLTSGNHTIQSGGQNRSYILRVPGRLRQQPRLPAGLRLPLAGRNRERRRLGRHGRVQLVLLRPQAPGGQREQQHDLRRPPGQRQRLGQPRWPGRGLRRRHGQPDRIGPVRRHHPVVLRWLQLRRRDVVRPRLLPGDGLPRGRGLLRREPQRVQRRQPAHRLHGTARPQGQCAPHPVGRDCATPSSGPTAAPRRTRPSRPTEA